LVGPHQHSDQRSSAVDDHIVVIDMEYTRMGPFSFDLGYFLANFLSQFAAWSSNTAYSQQHRAMMCQYLLGVIRDVFAQYRKWFDTCLRQTAQRSTATTSNQWYTDLVREAAGFIALPCISRVVQGTGFPDFDVIENIEDHWFAKTLALELGIEILAKRHTLAGPAALTTLLDLKARELLLKANRY
jgi:5-methylthioribose kinase